LPIFVFHIQHVLFFANFLGAASIDEPQGFSGSPPVVSIMYRKCVIIPANKDVLFCSVLCELL